MTMTEPNTDYDMVASGGNFVARNPERSATGIDFPQYSGEKNIGSDINILKNKIETGGKKESSDNEIPDDLNEMEYLEEANMDEDQLDEKNENDVQNIVQAEERQDDNEKSTANNIDTGNEKNTSDMGQNDTISKIELNPSFVLSSDNTNCKNDIQLFPKLFDELRVNGDYH